MSLVDLSLVAARVALVVALVQLALAVALVAWESWRGRGP